MRIRFIFIVSLVWLFINIGLKGQEISNLAIGLNLTNNIKNIIRNNYASNNSVYSKGIFIEPIFIYKKNSKLSFQAILGYSKTSIKQDYKYQNINYTNQGYYLKFGILTPFHAKEDNLLLQSFGLNLAFSHYKVSGIYNIRGSYFGGTINNFNVKNQINIFIEPCLNIYIFKKKQIVILTRVNLPFRIFEFNNTNMPNDLIPGYGTRFSRGNSFKEWFNYMNINYSIYRVDIYIIIPLKY